MNWLRKLFDSSEVLKLIGTTPAICAGEVWELEPDHDPWGGKPGPKVKILEVNGGWVRYHMNRIFPDERKTIENFTLIYRKCDED